MTWDEVVAVLDQLDHAGCRYWLEGGWGVAALAGIQTRAHRDLDIDLDASHEGVALRVLHGLGYEIETDWRPNRVELIKDGHGWVDLHPLDIDEGGGARQASFDGGFHEFPSRYFTTGTVHGRRIPCVSLEAQLAFHQGYAPRPSDEHDVAVLHRLQNRDHL